jgi:hypothetical protein
MTLNRLAFGRRSRRLLSGRLLEAFSQDALRLAVEDALRLRKAASDGLLTMMGASVVGDSESLGIHGVPSGWPCREAAATRIRFRSSLRPCRGLRQLA